MPQSAAGVRRVGINIARPAGVAARQRIVIQLHRGIGNNRRYIVSHVDDDCSFDRIPVGIGCGVGESFEITVNVVGVVTALVDGETIDWPSQRIAPLAIRVQRERTVSAVARSIECVTNCSCHSERAAGGFAIQSRLAADVCQSRFIDHLVLIVGEQRDIGQVDRQRSGRRVSIAINDGVDEHILRACSDRIGARDITIGAVKVQRQGTIEAGNLGPNPTRHLSCDVFTGSTHSNERHTIRTGSIVREHTGALGRSDLSTFGYACAVRSGGRSVVDNGNDEVVIIAIPIKVRNGDGERNSGTSSAERIVV